MKLNAYSSFSTLTILLLTFFNVETRTPKKTENPVPEKSSNHWENYGDNWSQWAENWSSGWSEDDKHTTAHEPIDQSTLVENESVTLFGAKEMTGKHIKKNLTIYGAGVLTDVQVGEVLTDYGKLTAKKCSFNQLDVYGSTVLENSKVEKNANIYGTFTAQSCTFKSSIAACSTTIVLKDSKVRGDILIKRDKGIIKQVVELENTIVEGSITFEKNKGTVILKGTSSVKGDILGGTISKK